MVRPSLLGIDGAVEHLLNQPPALVLALVFLVPALEASIMAGVIFPGEIVVLLGGVVASEGRTPLWAVLTAAIVGAVAGDAVGYVVGRRWGAGLLLRLPERLVKPEHVATGLRVLHRLGWKAVVLGRWTALLRALVPGLAGMSGIRARTFLLANLVGGAVWASAVVVAGYAAGNGWRKAQSALGTASLVLGGLVLGVIIIVVLVQRRRRVHRERAGEGAGHAGGAREDEAPTMAEVVQTLPGPGAH
jgi:membrane-associated protein